MNLVSQNILKQLYLRQIPSSSKPILQVLGIERSETKNNQFTIRLSDGSTYLDAIFIPKAGVEWTQNELYIREGMSIKKFDLISLQQYESRLNLQSLYKLQMIIKKISFHKRFRTKIGRPEEISEFAQNQGFGAGVQNTIKLQVDLQEEDNEQTLQGNKDALQTLFDSTMTINQVLKQNRCDMIARVIRKKVKIQKKNNKDFTILVFHILDKNGDVMKCEGFGKQALNNQAKIQIGKIFKFEGLEVAFNNYLQLYFLRLGKDYNIIEVQSPNIDKLFLMEKYCFFEDSKNKSQSIDLIGAFVSVDEPKQYTKNTGDIRKVTRLKILSTGKPITVSFWGENSNILENQLLISGEPIILLDVVRKGEFFEFNSDSTFIRMNSDPTILKRNPQFQAMITIPPTVEQSDNQSHHIHILTIKQCRNIEYGGQNREIIYVYGYISRLCDSNLYYATCKNCSIRVKNLDTFCQQCNCNHFVYKYAALIGISDWSDYLEGMCFGDFLNLVLGKSAAQMNQLHRMQGLKDLLNLGCRAQQYLFGLDFVKQKTGRNKIVIKSIQKAEQSKQRSQYNLSKILRIMNSDQKMI